MILDMVITRIRTDGSKYEILSIKISEILGKSMYHICVDLVEIDSLNMK